MAEQGEPKKARRNPNVWVPTLYYTEGFPYTTVTETCAVFFKTLGASLEALGVFQAILNMPWAFKFLWSPLVELFGTKRGWILIVQGMLCVALAGLALAAAQPTGSNILSLKLSVVNTADNRANAGFIFGLFALIFCLGFGMDAKRPAAVRVGCFAGAAAVAGLFAAFKEKIFVTQALSLPAGAWVVFAAFLAIALFSATQDIAIDGYYMDALDAKAQAAYSGVRVMFYRVAMIVGGGVVMMIAGKWSWTVGYVFGAAIFAVMLVFHAAYLPRPLAPARGPAGDAPRKSFSDAFTSYLGQKRIILIFLFILFFRVDDFLWKPMSKPFLMDIGVTVAQIGFLQGVLGVAATIAGSLIGGIYIARRGLTRSLWVLGIIQSTNLLLYAYLAIVHSVIPKEALEKGAFIGKMGLIHVAAVNTLENLAIGLGTIAFVNFIMRTCKKEYTSAHYAIATGFMGLSAMFAGFFSGFLAKQMGYTQFFIFCFIASIPGLVVLYFLPLKELEERAKAQS